MDATNRKLRGLVRKHGLTYAKVAELAGAGTSIKAVEGWLASLGAVSYRTLPAYRLELIEVRLQKAIQEGKL
jgi:hypothetical protein